MSEVNKALVRRLFDELWEKGDLSVADQIYTPDHIRHDPSAPARGPEGEKQLVAMYRGAFPDLTFTVWNLIAEGDLVACCWSTRATHLGELMGIPPTGKSAPVTGIAMFRIAGGRIAEAWANWDTLGMFQQLGVSPPSPVAEQNKALAQLVEQIWAQKDPALVDQICAPDAVWYRPDGIVRGPEELRRLLAMYIAAVPDCRLSIDDVTAEGDKVVIRWTFAGTHQGELMGIAPTGRPVSVPGISIFRFVGGKIVEAHEAWDTMSIMQQLGAVPQAAKAGA